MTQEEDDMGNIIEYLKETDIFYQTTTTQLEMIANLCLEVEFSAGDIILEEGSSSKELYVITRGEVEVLVNPALVAKTINQASQNVIATLRRGQSFGEIALVDEGARSASVRAKGKVTKLLLIPREKLLLLCESYPQLGYHIMYNLAADLAMKIRNTDLRVRESLLHGMIHV